MWALCTYQISSHWNADQSSPSPATDDFASEGFSSSLSRTGWEGFPVALCSFALFTPINTNCPWSHRKAPRGPRRWNSYRHQKWARENSISTVLHKEPFYHLNMGLFIPPCSFHMNYRKCSYTLSGPDLGILICTPLLTHRYYDFCSIVAHKHGSPTIVFYCV